MSNAVTLDTDAIITITRKGLLSIIGPGQVIGIDSNGEYFQPQGRALLFHP